MIIGMVGIRFAGLDGVSLEAAKVADALRSDGYGFAWFAGEIGPGFEPSVEVPAARFDTPGNQALEAAIFGGEAYTTEHRDRLLEEAARLEVALAEFIDSHRVDVLMIQNALAIPMQLPLGLAITNVLAASRMPAVAHHHDFEWERARFDRCAVPGLLDLAFPPPLSGLRHVVINAQAAEELERRRGRTSTVLPNVMDFETEPAPGDRGAYRAAAGLRSEDTVLLQPTRVIPRKGIESTIELAAALRDSSVRVVVTHPDDTDHAYLRSLERLAAERGVDMRALSPAEAGCELEDAYAAADLVCFPSLVEGFGNALLEACYFRKPVFVNRYPVYVRDIAPTGLDCIEMDGAVTREAVEEVAAWLANTERVRAATDINYAVGLEHFSFRVARERLGPLLTP